MPDDILQINDARLLSEKLADILVNGSLYRHFVYVGKSCHGTMTNRFGENPRYGLLPKRLRMFCDNPECGNEQSWEIDQELVIFGGDFIKQSRYTCRNCGKKHQNYLFIWQENKDSNVFLKVGQYPPLTIEPSPDLAKALGVDDSELYKKGLVNFNFGYGIGAVGYFRRVLENKVNALLDLIAEAAQNEQLEGNFLKTVEEVKNSRRVEDKIKVASKVLPASLKPGGHNPLDKLYAPLSAGLHGESDDYCLTVFKEARFVFEYLFKNLRESNEEARRYVKELSAPKSKKAETNTVGEPTTGVEPSS